MSLDSNPPGREAITTLVGAFGANSRTLRDPQTCEAAVPQEYIDPFWEALGRDVGNTAHLAAAEKDVVIEASVGTIEG